MPDFLQALSGLVGQSQGGNIFEDVYRARQEKEADIERNLAALGYLGQQPQQISERRSNFGQMLEGLGLLGKPDPRELTPVEQAIVKQAYMKGRGAEQALRGGDIELSLRERQLKDAPEAFLEKQRQRERAQKQFDAFVKQQGWAEESHDWQRARQGWAQEEEQWQGLLRDRKRGEFPIEDEANYLQLLNQRRSQDIELSKLKSGIKQIELEMKALASDLGGTGVPTGFTQAEYMQVLKLKHEALVNAYYERESYLADAGPGEVTTLSGPKAEQLIGDKLSVFEKGRFADPTVRPGARPRPARTPMPGE